VFLDALTLLTILYISPWLALIRHTDIGLDVLDENEGFLDALTFSYESFKKNEGFVYARMLA
jgi:hypothetical protein